MTQDLPGVGEALVGAFIRAQRALALVRAEPDGSGRIVKANASFADLTARTPHTLVGADVLDVLGCGRRAEAREIMRKVADGDDPSAELHSRLVCPDGRVLSLELELTGADDHQLPGRWVLVGARDISAEVREGEKRRIRDLITGVVAAAASVDGAISALLPALGDALGFAFGAVWDVDEQAGELRCRGLWEAGSGTASYAAASRERPVRRGVGLLGRAWETDAPIATTDLAAQECPRKPAAERDELSCGVAFPCCVGTELHAVVEFAGNTQRDVTEPLRSVLADMSLEIAGLLSRKREQERQPGTTLLLVEDNAFIARLVAEMLATQDAPLELVHVERLADALVSLVASRPACVLLDLTLPDASGLQALVDVRRAVPDVPVVVLTGTEDEELAVRAVQEGAQDYLVKHKVDLNGLGRAIRYAIERKSVEQQRLRHELTDRLTGLPNRVLFTDRVSVALARTGRGCVGVLLINLDRFRLVNDSLGYEWGDRLLTAAADRIVRAAPAGASVASFGGDEFAVLVDGASADDAMRLAEELAETLSAAYDLDGQPVHISAAVGIATAVGGGCTAEMLIAQADTALSRAKQSDGPRYEIFDEALREEMRERLALHTGLHGAMEKAQLRLHYQPLVSLEDGQVIGFEALVRWEHPDRGLIPPSEFLPLAEESSLIVAIGRWVLREAIGRLVAWDAERVDRPPLVMHVNLSARELAEPDLVDTVATTLRGFGAAPERLCLEVTETALIGDLERSARTLTALNRLGVNVALDDFGTGYSSLSYLQRFPVTVLKLDRSFVDAMVSEGKRPIVGAVANMAEALDMHSVAEGIETEEQLEQLRTLGYTIGQGWRFGRAVPEDAAQAVALSTTFGQLS
jgi:diguanylate cyclase